MLRTKGVQVMLADSDMPGSASRVAAGIINPVTGKRFVKSWRLDDFFPAAQRHYQALETELQVKIWEKRPILRLLTPGEEANNWSTRCALPEYESLLSEAIHAGAWSPLLKPGFKFGAIQGAARVNFPKLLAAFRAQALAAGQVLEKTVAYEDTENLLKQFDRVVFCEGYRAQHNPFFPALSWQLAKGEALLIRFQDARANYITDMLKKSNLVAPLGEGLFWAGGSYQWDYPNLEPTPGERDYILMRLNEILEAPFAVISHAAGIRPTVKDRRPFLGESVLLSNVFMFNGIGTKGALLAPFWAEHLAEHLVAGTPIDPEVWVGRMY